MKFVLAIASYPPLWRHPPRGGCGLKFPLPRAHPLLVGSPSMRRVWIEMINLIVCLNERDVTLHAEGVD